jgi:integration host factor subunit alpha
VVKRTIDRDTLSKRISAKHPIGHKKAYIFIDVALTEIANALQGDKEVKLPNFGVFFTRYKKERMGRNPRTLEAAKISARRVVNFRYARSLRDGVHSGLENHKKDSVVSKDPMDTSKEHLKKQEV